MEKTAALFSEQVPVITAVLRPVCAGYSELQGLLPKISRGERYQELPYMILDYPALFSAKDIFALRTMFLWGSCMSVTIQLAGKYKQDYETLLYRKLKKDAGDFYIAVTEDQWLHHFEPADNYVPVKQLTEEELHKKIMQPSFIKVALKYDLDDFDKTAHDLAGAYRKIGLLLQKD
ncbi:MAG: hypothetical protein QM687_15675 [Ferruginibacter sp.]